MAKGNQLGSRPSGARTRRFFPYVRQKFWLELETTTLKTGEVRCEMVAGLSSRNPSELPSKALPEAIRLHGALENKAPWNRDVNWREDHSRIRTGAAAHVLARNAVFSWLDLKKKHFNLAKDLPPRPKGRGGRSSGEKRGPNLRPSLEKRMSDGWCELESDYIGGLRAAVSLNHIKFDTLALVERSETFAINGAVVHKDITAVFPLQEAVTLFRTKPLDSSGHAQIYPPS